MILNDTQTHAAYQIDSTTPAIDRNGRRPWSAWTALVLALVIAGPIFVCLPLTNDTEYYDLQTRNILNGGVLYRDMLEPNLAGVVWVHLVIRTLGGFHSEVMRLADLTLWGVALTLLYRWLRSAGTRAGVAAWTVTAIAWCYLSQSEWSHCQRDGWLLPWAFGGLWLRQRQTLRMIAPDSRLLPIAGWSCVEGVIWACGFWIKPHIAFPAAAAWLVSAAIARRPGRSAADLAGLLIGGGLVGAAGCAWLIATGAWEPFWTTVREWHPDYVRAGREHWRLWRLAGTVYRFAPWSLLVPVALVPAVKWLTARRSVDGDAPSDRSHDIQQKLLASAWLGWLAQTLLLQHQFDYVFVPVVVLSIVMVARWVADWSAWPVRMPAGIVFLGLALFGSPVLRSDRLAAWPRCWREGSSPAVRQTLALWTNPNWKDLQRAEAYLRRQGVRNHDVLCFHNSLIYLYQDLGLRPPTRFVYPESMLIYFPSRRREILRDLRAQHPDFVVTDLLSIGLRPDQAQQPGLTPRDPFPQSVPDQVRKSYPWNLPVVFRAGSVLVHKAAPAGARLASTADQNTAAQPDGQQAASPEGTVR